MNEHQVITSTQHPLVKHLVKLRLESTYRLAQKKLILEGFKPIQEASNKITKLLYTAAYASQSNFFSGEKWQVTEEIVKKVSGLSSPQGILAEISLPPFVSLDKSRQVLALDGISDPGNLGTLLRTALALGWDTVYFLPGGCDPYNDKTLRSARGAHFKLSLAKGSIEYLQEWVKKEHVQAFVADLQGKSVISSVPAARRLLVMGNEAHGASAAIKKFCQSITIPMTDEMESLNVGVAGGILLYLLSKQ